MNRNASWWFSFLVKLTPSPSTFSTLFSESRPFSEAGIIDLGIKLNEETLEQNCRNRKVESNFKTYSNFAIIQLSRLLFRAADFSSIKVSGCSRFYLFFFWILSLVIRLITSNSSWTVSTIFLHQKFETSFKYSDRILIVLVLISRQINANQNANL